MPHYTLKKSKHFVVSEVLMSAVEFQFDEPEKRPSSSLSLRGAICRSLKRIGVVLSKIYGNVVFFSGTVLAILATVKILTTPEDTLPLFILSLMVPLRIFMALFKASSMCKLKISLMHIFSATTKDVPYPAVLKPEVQIYNRDVGKTPWLLVLLVVCSLLQNVPALIVAEMNTYPNEEILIPIWLPRGLELEQWIIGAINTAEVASVVALGYLVYGFAALVISLISFASKMLQHLNRVLRIAAVRSGDDDERFAMLSNKDMADVVRYAVQQHQRCIHFVRHINAIFALVMLLDVWSFLYSLCAVSYYFVKLPNEYPIMIKALIQNIVTTALYLGLACWHADTVTSEATIFSKNQSNVKNKHVSRANW
ncbi:uncharacterized protein LOC132198194 isoform X2 [Neocloeon triangulifer]|nr:uncharacterized protein LOC132198194 isoform X2 [Neocloeon triangulifer]